MSYIPNVRSRLKPQLTGKSPAEKNGYWQGYLSEADAREVAGFDLAITQTVNSFFDNIDFYDSNEAAAFISPNDVGLTLPEYFENHPEFADELRDCLKCWAELERDELVVSLFDSMDRDEYDKRVEEAENGKLNCLFEYKFEQDTLEDGYIHDKEPDGTVTLSVYDETDSSGQERTAADRSGQ